MKKDPWPIILKNAGLVGYVIKKYFPWALDHFEWRELMQEGMIGFRRAVQKYDKKRKTKLTTYAVFWIKQRIRRYIQNNRYTIRVPIYVHERIFKEKKKRESRDIVELREYGDAAGCAVRIFVQCAR